MSIQSKCFAVFVPGYTFLAKSGSGSVESRTSARSSAHGAATNQQNLSLFYAADITPPYIFLLIINTISLSLSLSLWTTSFLLSLSVFVSIFFTPQLLCKSVFSVCLCSAPNSNRSRLKSVHINNLFRNHQPPYLQSFQPLQWIFVLFTVYYGLGKYIKQ